MVSKTHKKLTLPTYVKKSAEHNVTDLSLVPLNMIDRSHITNLLGKVVSHYEWFGEENPT